MDENRFNQYAMSLLFTLEPSAVMRELRSVRGRITTGDGY